MRQIEKDMLAAIKAGREFKQANTQVHHAGPIVEVYLHGNLIARRDTADAQAPEWRFNLQGWNTPTTRSRLNALGAGVRAIAGMPHVMGEPVPVEGWF
jgi:hypothetical protein